MIEGGWVETIIIDDRTSDAQRPALECWALMATAFAVGVMNVCRMVLLGALALTEQIAPHGHSLRRAIGAALLVGGIVRLGALV
jgi:predicted metal-binding membrane protein